MVSGFFVLAVCTIAQNCSLNLSTPVFFGFCFVYVGFITPKRCVPTHMVRKFSIASSAHLRPMVLNLRCVLESWAGIANCSEDG